MKQRQTWLLALLSILTFVMVPCLATAASSGQLELGVSYTDIVDNAARVNEYVKNGASDNIKEDGLAASIKLDLEATDGVSAGDLSADIVNSDNYSLETGFDAARIFKLDISLDSMQHIKDHDNLEHLGATFTGDTFGDQPRVTTDLTAGQIPATPSLSVLTAAQERYYQELDNEYITTRQETEIETSLTLPTLPNITFHAGLRVESRDGLEQATTTSKCSQCHVQANAKGIDERTEDFTIGATGKFGKATIEYEFLTRDFTDNSANATYNYLRATKARAGIVDQDQLIYWGNHEYKATPDSEKDSHLIKARYDINRDSSISAAYVNAEIESSKTGEDGTYTLDTETLTSEYESFFLKGATRIGGLRLSLRGGTYEIDGPDYYVTFPDRDTMLDSNGTVVASTVENQDFENPEHFESAETRDVTEFGIDGVYRLAKGTTLRLGYEFEAVDREEVEFGETETNTFKVSLKSRLSRQLSGRISYEYQDINDPFHGEEMTGIAQGIGETDPLYPGLEWLLTDTFRDDGINPTNNAVYYWNSVYPSRTMDTSTSPESVHEAKFSSTWAPSPTMAATIFARLRMEENDSVKYQQDTFVPGASFYYAPSNKLNMTMAYTFNKQKTENQMCVGWYHG